MIQSYKKKPALKEKYDVIIIGSGMGSLTTGAILAKQGKTVLILERHYTAGGFTHIFKRKGYEWDVGVHYIGEVQKEKSIVKKLFDYITDSELKWADMGDVYDKIIIGEKEYDFRKGVQNFKDQMLEYFPNEKQAIDDYVNLVFLANKSSKNFYLEKTLSPIPSKIIGSFLRRKYHKYSDKTTYEVLSSITSNEQLIKVLCGQYGDYGLAPKKSSFSMHAAVARHYFSGASFPIGGSSKITETILPIINKSGGTVLISAEVDKVLVEKNKAIGVQMKDGKQFHAEHIVSGAGIFTTYNKLLPKEIVLKHNFIDKLKQINRSVSHGCLYVGLQGSPRDLKLPKTNYWIYPEDLGHDECISRFIKDTNQPFPVVYISFPSAKDPDWENRYPNRSTIDIITLLPYGPFENWSNTNWKKRGQGYEDFKEEIAQRLLKVLYKHVPQTEGKVDYYELSTPLTTKHFINYDKGEIYGLDHTPKRFRQKFLRPKTPIKNFYLTGQDIATAGVASALFSGVLTASVILKKNVLKKIIKN